MFPSVGSSPVSFDIRAASSIYSPRMLAKRVLSVTSGIYDLTRGALYPHPDSSRRMTEHGSRMFECFTADIQLFPVPLVMFQEVDDADDLALLFGLFLSIGADLLLELSACLCEPLLYLFIFCGL